MPRANNKETKKPPSPAKRLAALRERFAGFKPAREALEEVVAIPTCFIQLDWATRVGGWPTKRTCIVHGPSNHGKSTLLLGLAGSFVRAGGMADYVDAEGTTPFSWVRKILGPIADDDRFIARPPPAHYERCIDDTRIIHRRFKEAKEAGELPAHASLITLIDSLPKLIPEDAVRKISSLGASGEKGSADGMGGRVGMIQANMNKVWLNALTSLTWECGTAWTAITRESVDTDASAWDRKIGEDFNLIGGNAVVFDSALIIRVTRENFIDLGEGKEKKTVGERHRVTIRKTKVGGKESQATVGFFHTSNGVIAPEGLDRARDVVELALKLGALVRAGATIRWPKRGDGMFARSQETAISSLRFAEDDLDQLEAETRALFATASPEVDDSEIEAPHVEIPA